MILDLLFLLIIIISCIVGYYKGFFIELYSLIKIIISLLLTYIINNLLGLHILGNITIKGCKYGDLLSKYLMPILSGILLYIIIYIIVSIVINNLIKKNKIPSDKNKYKLFGILISLLKTIFYLTFVSFFLSFTTLVDDFNVYKNTSIVPVFLKINPVLYRLSDSVKDLYDNAIETAKIMSKIDEIEELDDKQVDTIKSLFKNDLITEDILVESSKTIFNNMDIDREEINNDNIDVKEVKEEVQDEKLYPVLKDLYDEKVLTDDLIIQILKENNINNIDKEDINYIFNE
jgi:uncharacterized membrane protein required for colicin V production